MPYTTLFACRLLPALLCTFGAVSSAAAAVTQVHVPQHGEGSLPRAGVVADGRGSLYGIMQNSSRGPRGYLTRGCGLVYRIGARGKYRTLLDFSSLPAQDGCKAGGELLAEKDGLYGLTHNGGKDDQGTLFKLSPNGHHQVIHRFSGVEGSFPVGGLTRGGDGHLYGTTRMGGQHGAGTVFRLDASGRVEALYSFQHDTAVGSKTKDPLVLGPDGALYGSGLSNVIGKGTIYRVNVAGAVELVRAMNDEEGCYPSGLSLGRDGWLYGAAMLCGRYGLGTLFRVHPDGRLQTLHHFSGPDGSGARDRPTQGPDGAWYGTTIGYLEGSAGTLYRFRPEAHNGVETLHLFNLRPEDGVDPVGPVLPMADGAVYGTTQHGGNAKGPQGLGPGMVYRYPPLPAN